MTKTRVQLIRRIVRLLTAASFVWVGVQHFVKPALFVAIVPPALPAHLELVYLSGVFEVLLGLMLIPQRTRRLAGFGLLALLVAVYPANIHMLVNEVYLPGMPREKWLLWARMPFQLVFAAGAAWSAEIWPKTRTAPPSQASLSKAPQKRGKDSVPLADADAEASSSATAAAD